MSLNTKERVRERKKERWWALWVYFTHQLLGLYHFPHARLLTLYIQIVFFFFGVCKNGCLLDFCVYVLCIDMPLCLITLNNCALSHIWWSLSKTASIFCNWVASCFYVFGPWLNSINGLFCFVTVDVNYFLPVMLVLIGCNLFTLGENLFIFFMPKLDKSY